MSNHEGDLDEMNDVPVGDPEWTCVVCNREITTGEAVHCKGGWAHEDCAEKAYPYDPNRDPGIPKY